MINPDSDLYRTLRLGAGAAGLRAGYRALQWVLDLGNPQVFDYLFKYMAWLLGEHPIDYVKWDMNTRAGSGGHNGNGVGCTNSPVLPPVGRT